MNLLRLITIFVIALSAVAAVKVEKWPDGKTKERIDRTQNADGKTEVKFQSFYSNGQLARVYTEIDDKYEGKVEEYDRDGHVLLTENYRNGVMEGEAIYITYDDEGVKGTKQEFYEKGAIVRRVEKDRTGKKTRDESYNLDGLIDYK